MSKATKVEIKKISTGEFDVLSDGIVTHQIFNGDAGASGRGSNCYGIRTLATGTSRRIGTLQAAKRIVSGWIRLAP